MKVKNGISLIVLVITVIVMVVLAGAIILVLNNSGIIGKASETVEKTNEATIKEIASLAWAEAYASGARTQKELEYAVTQALNKLNIDMSSYKITVTTSGVSVEKIDVALHHSGIIPEGATYTTGIKWIWESSEHSDQGMGHADLSGSVTYTAGQPFPETPQVLDRYTYGDYTYVYSAAWYYEPYKASLDKQWFDAEYEGWLVTVYNNTDKTSYGTILETVIGKPIMSMYCLFYDSSQATEVPKIPSGVINLNSAYSGTSIITLPDGFTISEEITDINNMFSGCSKLTGVPETFVIPEKATEVSWAFAGCTSLTGTIRIDATPSSYQGVFESCDMSKITIVGDCANKDALIATGKNGGTTPESSGKIIPEGATYYSVNNGTLTAGQQFPNTVTALDRYTYGDYTYVYNAYWAYEPYTTTVDRQWDTSNYEGWLVTVHGNTGKTTYGTILEEINGKPVTSMDCLFYASSQVTQVPLIPSSVTNVASAFSSTSITTLPNGFTIPEGVTDIGGIFAGCSKLQSLPSSFKIPSTVVNMGPAFASCTSLTGTIRIDATPTSYEYCFQDCDMSKITIVGDCANKDALIATAN